jgi:TIR domain
MILAADELTNFLRVFKSRRDALLHEAVETFDYHLERFIRFCGENTLVQEVLVPLEAKFDLDVDGWLSAAYEHEAKLAFPPGEDEELILRYRVLQKTVDDTHLPLHFGLAHGQHKQDEWMAYFQVVIVRPFVDDLTHRIGVAANLATPEARTVQAVPLNRMPSPKEVRIFLSHKSVDKPMVYLYHHALKAVGFDPWLDESDMPAGSNLEREVLRGFEESCAAVFFITANFKDESYLAAEVDYAVMQKRKKGKKFAIITLRYANAEQVPALLLPYIYKDVANDLDGFRELVRALPIECGRICWKVDVV